MARRRTGDGGDRDAHRTIAARVWRTAVGRTTLFLLDSNVEGNSPEDRELTARLYGGDHRVRIRQELLLGIGGVKALAALGISPGVVHLNEGHSAFASLELVRRRMESEGISFDEAMRRVSSQVVFTTHTPVPAGHDRFAAELVEEHLGPVRDALGLSHDGLLALGRVNPHDWNEEFCMTVLALKTSHRANAVSSLHGQVSRAMWTPLFPGVREEHIPIGHVTNGVHVKSWLAPQMRLVYDRHLGAGLARAQRRSRALGRDRGHRRWRVVGGASDAQGAADRLTRRRLVLQAERRGEPASASSRNCRRVLSRDALTIGFARRFATYKRANLLLQDLEPARIAGERSADARCSSSSPARRIRSTARARPSCRRSPVWRATRGSPARSCSSRTTTSTSAAHLVQGVDVWLNNPRRPLEACGTSGQKVVLNGALNLSVLDGWWAEAYDGLNGFAIGIGETHTSSDDARRARRRRACATVLRDEVVPLYYDRDRDGLPREWIARMKRAIRTLGWRFSADRMVMDYVLKSYIPAAGGTSSDVRGF